MPPGAVVGILRPRPSSVYTKYVFEWNGKKAAANLVKHDVSFDQSTTVFADPGALDGPDVGHSGWTIDS